LVCALEVANDRLAIWEGVHEPHDRRGFVEVCAEQRCARFRGLDQVDGMRGSLPQPCLTAAPHPKLADEDDRLGHSSLLLVAVLIIVQACSHRALTSTRARGAG
jgi:hypothetical protein